MRFQVPQFIEVEDKIFGPLTFKQFVYLAGGAGLSFILWSVLPLYFSVPIILLAAGLSLALAFYKVHEQPFINVLQSAFFYAVNKKLYIWKKKEKLPEKIEAEKKTAEIIVPKLSKSKLKEIGWALDVQDLSGNSGVGINK